MSDPSEPPEKWQRLLAAAKATQPGDAASVPAAPPPKEFSAKLIGRLRALHASLAAWQRWSLLAGLASILLFIASFIYLKATTRPQAAPIIEAPALDLPAPSPTTPESDAQ